jgi:GNAT superfamily N-acetyltransferase
MGATVPKEATTDEEIESCYDVMAELRTHVEKEKFLPLIRQMEAQGYRLVFVEEDGQVVAVAGYRIYTNLILGKNMYVDDLVTTQKVRSKGNGAKLIKWLREKAKDSGCGFYHLDSGTERHRAHKFYVSQGFTVSAFHFTEKL